jgi:hypothetical protein
VETFFTIGLDAEHCASTTTMVALALTKGVLFAAVYAHQINAGQSAAAAMAQAVETVPRPEWTPKDSSYLMDAVFVTGGTHLSCVKTARLPYRLISRPPAFTPLGVDMPSEKEVMETNRELKAQSEAALAEDMDSEASD